MNEQSYDNIWDEIYENGHIQKAPWDSVVSFVYRYKPKGLDAKEIKILEVGCGTASNLRFFAREGFAVYGIDASTKAIKTASELIKKDGHSGTFLCGDFTQLDFEDNMFDMVIDRAAITCAGKEAQKQTIDEIYRVLKVGGVFLHTPYADSHASMKTGSLHKNGLVKNITGGTLIGVGQIRFVNQTDIEQLLHKPRWKIISLEYQTSEDLLHDKELRLHSSWKVISKKMQ